MKKQKAIRTYSRDEGLVNTRREHIAKASARLFIKKGYDQTTVREIAKACDMAMGTLYHYVGSKEDVLFLVIEIGASRIREFSNEIMSFSNTYSSIDTLCNAIEGYYRLVDDLQDLMIFTYQETANLEAQARKSVLDADVMIGGVFENILIQGQIRGEFRKQNTKLISHNIVTLGQMWATRRWFLGKIFTIDEYIREQTEIIKSVLCEPNKELDNSGKPKAEN